MEIRFLPLGEDYSTVTAKAVCARDDSHVLEETALVKEEISEQPDCTKTGLRILTAEFEHEVFKPQTLKQEVPALGTTSVSGRKNRMRQGITGFGSARAAMKHSDWRSRTKTVSIMI